MRLAGAALPLALAVALSAAAQGDDPQNADDGRRIDRQGIAVELEIEPAGGGAPREGEVATFRFRITDTNTSTPLSGLYPAAWMDLRPEGETTGPAACRDKVEAFVGGSLFAPPELDLNAYYVLALNDDATISVVDPLFGFGTTKLLDMIFLASPGEDWALSADRRTLFVSSPEADRLSVVDTATWDVSAELEVDPRPTRVALQSDGRYLWITHQPPGDGPSGVSVIDTETLETVAEIVTGRGRHEIAFDAGGRYAFVTNAVDGTLSVLDVGRLAKVRDVATGAEPIAVAYAARADAVYVVNRGDGTIVAVDARSHRRRARVAAEPGLGTIRFAPGGRLALIVDPERDRVHVLDAASNRIVQTATVEDGPDQIAFSDHLAYIRHRDSEIVVMIPLEQLGRDGAPVPVIDFPGGQSPFGRSARPSPADGIVQAPGATAVLVANPADRAIYFYKEGMAAPMGHFQNYGRRPRAVLAVDRSLRESAPGTYQTSVTLRRPGRYDVAFLLDTPRTVHCFAVDVEPSVEQAARRARQGRPVEVRPIVAGRERAAGETVALRVGEEVALDFALVDPVTEKPRSDLEDVRVLTFRTPGRDRRQRPARPVGEGVYRIEMMAPRAGIYYVFVESPSAGLRYDRGRALILVATDPPADDAPAGR